MTFSGVEGAPANSFPEPPYTTLDTTPISREKPFLYLDGADYKVFVPEKRENARGTSWANGTPAGESIPLDQFYVVKEGADAATINAAVEQGLHLLFTPGVYHIDETINIDRPDTVALGIGLATIIPDNGVTAIKVGDVDGVKLAGLLVDAGPVNSETLIEVGPENASADHSANPTSLQDVFVRIGGAGPGKATTSIVVNSDDTIIDHTWVWRADHGEGWGWETNRADYGVRVNGDDVLATGLFVEHFNKYDVEWYGERGRTIFFQNEKAYDAPNQAAIQNGDTKGYAAYRVDDSVEQHEGWGMGSYCYYNVDPTIIQEHGFKAPVKPGVKFHSLIVVSLGGNGQYEHVINDVGSPTSGPDTIPSQVVNFP
ncbi:Coagulation factor 5/8 type domain-containing protein OS=Streptomyces microflavus OX=1919 GN=Smic_54530 PE=4 SV=1 [Streptomyces microflavus]